MYIHDESPHIIGPSEGGVHICKLAYGDLTWEKLMLPKPFPLWYTISTLESPGSITSG